MPYKDEKIYWHVRITRDGGKKRKQRVEQMAKRLGFSSVEMMDAAVDNFLEKYEKSRLNGV